jgi:hypothetical protein
MRFYAENGAFCGLARAARFRAALTRESPRRLQTPPKRWFSRHTPIAPWRQNPLKSAFLHCDSNASVPMEAREALKSPQNEAFWRISLKARSRSIKK